MVLKIGLRHRKVRAVGTLERSIVQKLREEFREGQASRIKGHRLRMIIEGPETSKRLPWLNTGIL